MTLNGWQRLFVAYLVFVHLPVTGLIAYSEFTGAQWYGYGPVEPEVLKRLPKETVNLLESGRLASSGIDGCADGAIQITGVDALPRLPSNVCFKPAEDSQEPPMLSLEEQKARALESARKRLAKNQGALWENAPIVESRGRDMPELAPALRSISDAYRIKGVYEAATVAGWGLFFAVVLAALGWTVGWVVRGFRANSDAERTLPTQEGRSWLLALIRRIVLR